LNFEQSAVIDFIAKQQMGDFLAQAPFKSGNGTAMQNVALFNVIGFGKISSAPGFFAKAKMGSVRF